MTHKIRKDQFFRPYLPDIIDLQVYIVDVKVTIITDRGTISRSLKLPTSYLDLALDKAKASGLESELIVKEHAVDILHRYGISIDSIEAIIWR